MPKSSRTAELFIHLSLGLALLVGACSEPLAPATKDVDEPDDKTTTEPTTADEGQDAEPTKDAGKTTTPSTGKADSGKPSTTKPALDAGAGPSSPSVLDATVDVPDPDIDVSGDAATPAGDGGFVAPWVTRDDLGKGDGKDVITIGDSWMAGPLNTSGIEAALDRASTKYRHYGVTATTLLSGQIPGQYDSAKRANPKISTVIMTGGGNDVMFTGGSCSTPEACAEFSGKITAALNTLWTKMADDGVKDVIYVAYSENAGSTPVENRGGSKAVAEICYSGRISCHTVATTDIIAKSDLADGIHPGNAGNDRIAKRVLALMETRKMRR
jgi:lysophospholipase L1-like esterase